MTQVEHPSFFTCRIVRASTSNRDGQMYVKYAKTLIGNEIEKTKQINVLTFIGASTRD